MNVKHISELENGLINQAVFECRGLIIQGPLYPILGKTALMCSQCMCTRPSRDLHGYKAKLRLAILFCTCTCYRRNYIYWSDVSSDELFRSNMDGTDIEYLTNSTHDKSLIGKNYNATA